MLTFSSRCLARALIALFVTLAGQDPAAARARPARPRTGPWLLYRAAADSARIAGACAGERFAVVFHARGHARALELSDSTGATDFPLAEVTGEAVGACRDSFLYVALEGRSQLAAVPLTGPGRGTVVSAAHLPGQPTDLALHDTLVVVATRPRPQPGARGAPPPSRLFAFSVRDPAAVRQVGVLELVGSHGQSVEGLEVLDGGAWFSVSHATHELDLRDPASPRRGERILHGMHVLAFRGRLYAAAGESLAWRSIAGAGTPAPPGRAWLPISPQGLVSDGARLCAYERGNAVLFLNVDDAGQPRPAGTARLPGRPMGCVGTPAGALLGWNERALYRLDPLRAGPAPRPRGAQMGVDVTVRRDDVSVAFVPIDGHRGRWRVAPLLLPISIATGDRAAEDGRVGIQTVGLGLGGFATGLVLVAFTGEGLAGVGGLVLAATLGAALNSDVSYTLLGGRARGTSSQPSLGIFAATRSETFAPRHGPVTLRYEPAAGLRWNVPWGRRGEGLVHGVTLDAGLGGRADLRARHASTGHRPQWVFGLRLSRQVRL